LLPVKLTARPEEAVAATAKSASPNVCDETGPNEIVCGALFDSQSLMYIRSSIVV
jgi:hypothetical protein